MQATRMTAFKPTCLVTSVAAMIALAGCGQGGEKASGPSKSDPEVQNLLAELPASYSSADLSNGQGTFQLCKSCHTVVQGGPNMTGPNLYGVFGRQAGAGAGYSYSNALKSSGITWDAASLDKWVTDPHAFVPGTKMSFPGIKDAASRRDVIAYLKVASSGGPN